MTFRNVASSRNTAVAVKRVLLKRRCLQVLTGRARYDFSHEIENKDLLSERRVSVTMRESPLTTQSPSKNIVSAWWTHASRQGTLRKSEEALILPSLEPIPGLYLYYDFVTEEEEDVIMKELNDKSVVVWKRQRHTGSHSEKRFGVDHDLWSRDTRPPKYTLPAFMELILIPRLKRVAAMRGCVPTEVNAIAYRQSHGDSLQAHVDDRKKHSEPIANLSLCGECLMTYANTSPDRNLAVPEQKVLLKRRCLQVMTGKARYDYSHAIANKDLLSDQRVSLTMRETKIGG
jgi:alkylated DNA repair dioxygenase AlkB